MESEVYAAFILQGSDLDPSQVTALVGVQPSETWRAGDLVSDRAIVRRKLSGWKINSALPLNAPLEEHVEAVLQQLKPGWLSLVELGSRNQAKVYCVVRSYGGARPALIFKRGIVKQVAELNAAIEIDLYVFPQSRTTRRPA